MPGLVALYDAGCAVATPVAIPCSPHARTPRSSEGWEPSIWQDAASTGPTRRWPRQGKPTTQVVPCPTRGIMVHSNRVWTRIMEMLPPDSSYVDDLRLFFLFTDLFGINACICSSLFLMINNLWICVSNYQSIQSSS